MRSTNQNNKGEMHMDDYDGREFYKMEIDKLIEATNDIDLLDLVYKMLLVGA